MAVHFRERQLCYTTDFVFDYIDILSESQIKARMSTLWFSALAGFLLSLLCILYIDSIRVQPSSCVVVITKSSISIKSCDHLPDLTGLKGFNLSGVDCTL